MSFRWPVDNVVVSQDFGGNAAYYKQFGQIGHNGIDLANGVGVPVFAADEGTVVYEGWGQHHSWMGTPAGICVLLNNGGIHSSVAHLSRTVVNKGQRVVKGQLIGYVGATGAATGPHTHFEALPLSPNFKNGYAGRINPRPYIETAPAPQPQGGNKLMTPNFIKRLYWLAQGRVPDQGEIDFHMQKSTPESFANGFGDTPLWVTKQRELDASANQIRIVTDQLNAALSDGVSDEAQIKDLTQRLINAEAAHKTAADDLLVATGDIEEKRKVIMGKDLQIAALTEELRKSPAEGAEITKLKDAWKTFLQFVMQVIGKG